MLGEGGGVLPHVPGPIRDPLLGGEGAGALPVALSMQAPWCLADRGTVQKVIVLPRDDMETEELMLEEIEVFKVRAGPSCSCHCLSLAQPCPNSTPCLQLAPSSPLGSSGGTCSIIPLPAGPSSSPAAQGRSGVPPASGWAPPCPLLLPPSRCRHPSRR